MRAGKRAALSGSFRWGYARGARVSEYQYYEFIAVEQALSDKQMAELRAISTRAKITRTRFRNEYHLGDFRTDPGTLMARYFDAHRYFANWGCPRVMLRLPKAKLDVAALKPYFIGRSSTAIKVLRDHVVLDLNTQGDEREFTGDERVSLTSLAQLRTELTNGDLRSAYLAWLVGLENGEYNDRAREPPVPDGMAKRTRPQNALIRFLGISPHIVNAAVLMTRTGGKRRTVSQLLEAADELRNDSAAADDD